VHACRYRSVQQGDREALDLYIGTHHPIEVHMNEMRQEAFHRLNQS
jgi:hypothetical protein